VPTGRYHTSTGNRIIRIIERCPNKRWWNRHDKWKWNIAPPIEEMKVVPRPLSHESRMARKSLPPEILVGAIQDYAHKEVGRVRGCARGSVRCTNKDDGSIGI
jgi:hypothetical protein